MDVAIAITEKELRMLDDEIKALRRESVELERDLGLAKDATAKKDILERLKTVKRAIQEKEVLAIKKIRQLQDLQISKAG
jgi:hypothetical protein